MAVFCFFTPPVLEPEPVLFGGFDDGGTDDESGRFPAEFDNGRKEYLVADGVDLALPIVIARDDLLN